MHNKVKLTVAENLTSVFYMRTNKMCNRYLTSNEIREMVRELSPSEIDLYIAVRDLSYVKPEAYKLKNKYLAELIGTTEKLLSKQKSSLRKKGYMLIEHYKDPRGDAMVNVVLGKEQVMLYELGLKVRIVDYKAFKKLNAVYGLFDENITLEERKERLKAMLEDNEANRFIAEM